MARKRREEEHENHERWLVSYADFITLLFAFFVVMYAISSVNEGKYKVLSNSLTNAFRNVTGQPEGPPIAVIQGMPPIPPRPLAKPDKLPDQKKLEQRQKMKNVAGKLMKALQPLVAQGKVRLLETSRGVTIEINDSILFPAGQAKLQPASINAMLAIAQVLAVSDFPITIEGHTDNVPIATPQFPSNWELSAMRATTVLRLFNDGGVGAERLTAIGYGETRPVETNVTTEGRARNRRVSILIDSNRPEEPLEIQEGRSNR
ncbi:flagellar motor protein MotD [Dechloromonas denitrificans]|uniref:Flagellar motor protein MotD n=1 Tax=Dechloromonas denitrificans TaxID=281362 RepID=A0A133XHS9_9RHOO|nr:flagellar motor protein MotD [Dechloromonas denitrificans]KXB30495.1 flagellar motor protein MotD [Dechloromonas denitrificans]